MQLGSSPSRASSRWVSTMSWRESFRLRLHSSSERPCEIVPGISSTHPTKQPFPSGLMIVWYRCFMENILPNFRKPRQ